MIRNITEQTKLFSWTLLCLIVAEGASFWSFFNPIIGLVVGGIIVLATLLLSLKNIKNGLLIVVAELIVGSQGYLFFFDSGGSKISLRMALWIVVMGVWAGNTILHFFRDKNYFKNYQNFPYIKQFLLFASALLLGVVVALVSKNDQIFFFLELKRWLFILLLLPLVLSFKSTEDIRKLGTVIIAAIVALCLKVVVLIYIFSHSFLPLVYDVYAWMRLNLLGEITRWPSGFSRIFMQSQIFILPAAATFFLVAYRKIKSRSLSFNTKSLGIIILSIVSISVIIASLSRSFWVGAIFASLVTGIAYISVHKPRLKQIVAFFLVLLGSLVLSILFLFAIVRFPFPDPSANIDASLLTDRAITIEAGAASRWSLLPVMWEEIKKSPLLGYGFGKSLTYETYDPRIVATGGSGEYTTYAFEWGWLDMWLKFGLIGLIAYAWLLWKIFRDALYLLRKQVLVGSLIIFSLVSIIVVHFFTPYLNHPLGFSYLALLIIILENRKNIHVGESFS